MCIHVFAFRWKPDVSEEQRHRTMTKIRQLQGQIRGLLETWVGKNFSVRGQGYELGA
jgi:hypothetical protein